MKSREFDGLVRARLLKCQDILLTKRSEYAPETDRLSNFKTAAALQGCTAVQALGGMFAKHVVSVFDGIRTGHLSEAQWDEKLVDSINYLLLLEGLLSDEAN